MTAAYLSVTLRDELDLLSDILRASIVSELVSVLER
jgi:hypothetical protein